jgi:U3 small nucleolar RNA-associated protein 22
VVGSFLLRSGLSLDANVDVAVTMPAAMFQPKDRMNHRYQRKRALFVGRIAAILKGNPLFADLRFACAQGDPLRPILEVRPMRANGKPAKFVLRLFPTLEPDTFEVGIYFLKIFF